MNSKNGILYGVGVGPGDPEMLTLRAVRCIRLADAVCLPQSSPENCRAYRTAEQAVPEISGKPLICCDFKMTHDPAALEQNREENYGIIREHLLAGEQVVFLTVGDPAVYSTYMYMARKASSEGFRTETVSGIASFCAAAAALGLDLCEGDEELHIGTGHGGIEALLSLPGTKVIMKCGKEMPEIRAFLMRMEQEKKIRVCGVSDCGMPGERRYYSAGELPENGRYMTTVIVKERKEAE